MGIWFGEHERLNCGGIMSEIVSVPGCYLEGLAAHKSERLGAYVPETAVLDRTENAVVEGGDDRVTGHVSMIEQATDAALDEGENS